MREFFDLGLSHLFDEGLGHDPGMGAAVAAAYLFGERSRPFEVSADEAGHEQEKAIAQCIQHLRAFPALIGHLEIPLTYLTP